MKILLISQYANEIKKGIIPEDIKMFVHFSNYHKKIYDTLLKLGHTVLISSGTNDKELLNFVQLCDLIFPMKNYFGYPNGDVYIRLLSQKYEKKIIGGSSFSRFYESDKIAGKLLSEKLGVRTPQYMLPYNIDIDFDPPYILKSRFTGSSLMLTDDSVFVDRGSLIKYLQTLPNPESFYVEKYIDGITATIGCLLDGKGGIILCEPYTLMSRTHRVITFEDKRNGGCLRSSIKSQYIVEKMNEYCALFFKALQPCQIVRLDFMLSKMNELYFLEINETPNLSETGGFVQLLLKNQFKSFENLIVHLIETAISFDTSSKI